MCTADENFFSTKEMIMNKASAQEKVECLNATTGGRMNIDKNIYDQISKGVYDCFKKQGTKFEGSVGWYTVTVKKDMEARGIIKVFTEKGKKLHNIKK